MLSHLMTPSQVKSFDIKDDDTDSSLPAARALPPAASEGPSWSQPLSCLPQLTPTPSLTFLQVSTTHFLQRISQDLRQLGISLGTGALVNTE